MRRWLAVLVALPLLLALLPGAATAEPPDPEVIPGSYIVVLKTGNPEAVAAEHSRRHNAQVSHVYTHALRGYAARMAATAAARIAADSRVAYVDADRVVTTAHHQCGHSHPRHGDGPCDEPGPDPSPTPDPDPDPTDYSVPTGLQRIAWSEGSVGPEYPAVAVLDTGIANHPALNVAGGTNCSGGNPNNYKDGNGHGTHVAGTIGAAGGIVGVAPGAPLYAVKVLNNAGSGSWSGVICGVDWVTRNASMIKVANMSLGGGGSAGSDCTSSSLRQAICSSVNAGVTYVVAAGNSKANASGFVPAAYPEVITVAALADFDGQAGGGAAPTCRTDLDDTVANFSNYGAPVDIIAPGVCIESTWHSGSGYNTISGTSMASPHVAGAAAYHMRAATKSPTQVRSALQSAGTLDYSFTWDGTNPVPGSKWKLLDLRSL